MAVLHAAWKVEFMAAGHFGATLSVLQALVEIATGKQLSSSQTTNHLSRLEEAGLVTRDDSPRYWSKPQFRLTAAGEHHLLAYLVACGEPTG